MLSPKHWFLKINLGAADRRTPFQYDNEIINFFAIFPAKGKRLINC